MNPLKYTFQLFILTVIMTALFACGPIKVKSGRPFTISQIDLIERGSTLKSDIEKSFGQPQMTGKDDEGMEIWSYLYIRASVPLMGDKLEEEFQRLSITFMEGDVVKSFNYETSR
ncbi:MAG: hypothetical protein IMF07_06230 [Proteobacteria bacterium]|nr:hypothetical protein [Pseudomonadota bacterium]